MFCWSGCGVVDLAVSVFGLTAVVLAIAWRGCSVVDLENVSVSSVSPVSVVVAFVFALSLTAVVDVLEVSRSKEFSSLTHNCHLLCVLLYARI